MSIGLVLWGIGFANKAIPGNGIIPQGCQVLEFNVKFYLPLHFPFSLSLFLTFSPFLIFFLFLSSFCLILFFLLLIELFPSSPLFTLSFFSPLFSLSCFFTLFPLFPYPFSPFLTFLYPFPPFELWYFLFFDYSMESDFACSFILYKGIRCSSHLALLVNTTFSGQLLSHLLVLLSFDQSGSVHTIKRYVV